jgi:outer membrane receptor for ferrienterochelin and colicins
LPGSTKLVVRGYVDRNELIAHLVTDPSVKAHSSVRFSDWDAGFIAELSGSYGASSAGRRGQWLAGAQADVMRVFDGVLMSGSGGGWTTVGPTNGLVESGHEKIYSGYVTFKQPVGDRVIAHAGIRYDHKVRLEGAGIDRASPRGALVFLPTTRTTLAVSYSEGFIDAPYWYRYNSLPSYRGSRNLQPEYLKSFQVTPAFTVGRGVTITSNVFVNRLTDSIQRNKTAGPSDPNYQNAGFLGSWGVEPEIAYATPAFNLKGNLTYQRASSFEKYDVGGGEVHNVPAWTGNAILNVRLPAAGRDVWFNVTGRYVGRQLSPVNITIGSTVFHEPNRVVDAVFLTNAGVRVGNIGAGRWFLDARLYNLFAADYEQGGSVPHPYPQPGRSGMVQIGLKF